MEASAHYAIILCVYCALIVRIALDVLTGLFYQLLVIVAAHIIIIEMDLNAIYVMILCV